MKITQKKLKQIIKEELHSVLFEQPQTDPLANILQTIQALQAQVQGLIQAQAQVRAAQEKAQRQQKAIKPATPQQAAASTPALAPPG